MLIGRRTLLKGITSLIGWGTIVLQSKPALADPDITPDAVLKRLLEGNSRFIEQKRRNPHQNLARLVEVSEGQKPLAVILTCADSRVVPDIIFDRGIGDLFVVRVAGNVAPEAEIASLEYACHVLGVKLLVVMGHERCGAVQAALTGEKLPGLMGSLVEMILPAIAISEGKTGDRLENAIKANVLLQRDRVLLSELISQRVKGGKTKVIASYYDLDTGKVSLIE